MNEPAPMDKVTVALGARGYDIVVGRDLLAAAGEQLVPLAGGMPLTVISDTTVAGLHLATLTDSLDRAGLAWRALTVAPGEEAKSFARLETLLEDLLDLGIERSSTLIALGGGVIGDLVGLAASLALRLSLDVAIISRYSPGRMLEALRPLRRRKEPAG